MARKKRIEPPLPSSQPPLSEAPEDLDEDDGHGLLYRGAAGQLAVMSEFLYRSINVATPKVDIGDDIFVVKEKDETVTRVQVKYGKGKDQQNGSYVAQFMLPWAQFNQPTDQPRLVYALAVRYQDRWSDFIVIRRRILHRLHLNTGVGAVAVNRKQKETGLKLRLVFTGDEVMARRSLSLQRYRNAFLPWPPALPEES